MTNPLANNGPKAGNRNRNTVVNNYSKRGGYQAPISSATAFGAGDQLAAARYQYLQQLAALKAERPAIGAQFGTAVTDARTAAVGNMAAVQGANLDRGVSGSSSDLAQRAGVIAERQRAIADAQSVRAQAKLGLAQQAMGLRGDYYTDLASIQNSLAQEQMANTLAAFQNNQFDALQQNYQDVLAQLRARKSGNAPGQRRGAGRRHWRTADDFGQGYY